MPKPRTHESHGPWNTPRPVAGSGRCDLAHRLYAELAWRCPNDREEDPFKEVYNVFVPRIANVAAFGSEEDEAALREAMRREIARLSLARLG